ncbi:LuxR C-terminal-related transcriptional regulator [Salisediminibacterium beveridgei]|nr:response regulator transcription factor [Salisediminibacterium beveridgei]
MRIHLGIRHPLVRYGITQVLKDVFDLHYLVVSESESEWRSAMKKYAFDLIILHEDLYEMSIPEVFFTSNGLINEQYLKILIHTSAEGRHQTLFREYQVEGVFHEEVDIDQLMQFFDKVRQGERINLSQSGQGFLEDDEHPLTEREEEIFQLKVKGFSVNETARKLMIAPKTVENHRRNVKKKLGVKKGQDWYDWAKRLHYIR